MSKAAEISRLLVDNGADFQCLNVNAQTPFHTFPDQFSINCMMALETLFDFSALDSYSMSIMHFLAWSSQTSVENFESCYRWCRIPLTAAGKNGRTMLHLAAERGNIPLVEYILRSSTVDLVNIRDDFGRTALHSAIMSKRASEIIRILTLYGADLWAKDKRDESALHRARNLKKTLAVATLELQLKISMRSTVGNMLHKAPEDSTIDFGSHSAIRSQHPREKEQLEAAKSKASLSTQAHITSSSSPERQTLGCTPGIQSKSTGQPEWLSSPKESFCQYANITQKPWHDRSILSALVFLIGSACISFILAWH